MNFFFETLNNFKMEFTLDEEKPPKKGWFKNCLFFLLKWTINCGVFIYFIAKYLWEEHLIYLYNLISVIIPLPLAYYLFINSVFSQDMILDKICAYFLFLSVSFTIFFNFIFSVFYISKYEELKNKSNFIKFAQSDACEDKLIKYILFSPILNMCTFINSSFIHKKLFEENEIIKKSEDYKKTYYIYLISLLILEIPNILVSGYLLQKFDKKLDFVTLTFIVKSFLTILLSSLSFTIKIGWIKFNKN